MIHRRSIDFVTSDGLILRGDAWGDPQHRPVLLLHGGGQTAMSWSRTAKALAQKGYYAIAYDQRGHGQSDRSPTGNYDVGDFARDLTEVASTCATMPVVVGASLGGLAAMLAGSDATGSDAGARVFAAVVLVDITPRQERIGVNRVVEFMLDRAVEGFASLLEAAEAVAAYQPHRQRPADLDGLRKNLREDSDGRWRWHWDPELFNDRSGLRSAQQPDRFISAAERLAMPVLLVRGKLSDLVSPETAREFLDLVPHAEFVDVADAGHMVAGDRNDRFTEAVVDFLTRLPADTETQRSSAT